SEIAAPDGNGGGGGAKFEKGKAAELLSQSFDRAELSSKGLQYERLDQLTMDILLGVR
ncbi:MAG: xylose isomerase, partial [Acidobacteria bacterium]|nr:xylose isomerase [Acidobacteriota bacterium]